MTSSTGNDKPLGYGEMIRKLDVDDCDGKPVALTVRRAERRNLAPKNSRNDDWKIVIEFAEKFGGENDDDKRREYVVNSTSYKTLCDRLGKDETRWVGQTVVMSPTNNTFEGKTYEKMHVAAPERWDKVISATARARKK